MQVRNLKNAFIEQGHRAEIVAIPFRWHPPAQIVRSMLVWRLLDLKSANGEPVDLVVALKFPAYLIQHPNKVIWLTHQHRQAYDLMGTDYGDLGGDDETQKVREAITDADTRLIPEARRIYTISKTVAERLHKFNGIRADHLYHPAPAAGSLRGGGYGDYVFYPSRLDRLKRQELLIEAMAQVKSRATCVLAGAGPDEERLRGLIGRLGVQRRVKMLGFVNEHELADWYSGALAVYFGPFGEDYGYVTLEALQSRKAVLTLSDSGAPLEFVRDGVNGFVIPPKPAAIAEKIDRLFENKALAETLGTRGLEIIGGLEMGWDKVVRKLVS
ncbi:MAG: glycosyltransferase family 4 protein [Candidatus Binataceae bacterium]